MHRAVDARGDAAAPPAFWRAVDALQRLLCAAARDSCAGAFAYAALPANKPECSCCAKAGIDCLKAADAGDGHARCVACVCSGAVCVPVRGQSARARQHAAADVAVAVSGGGADAFEWDDDRSLNFVMKQGGAAASASARMRKRRNTV